MRGGCAQIVHCGSHHLSSTGTLLSIGHDASGQNPSGTTQDELSDASGPAEYLCYAEHQGRHNTQSNRTAGTGGGNMESRSQNHSQEDSYDPEQDAQVGAIALAFFFATQGEPPLMGKIMTTRSRPSAKPAPRMVARPPRPPISLPPKAQKQIHTVASGKAPTQGSGCR